MNKEYIYALYLEVEDQRLYYYVGRTNNIERRMSEHRTASRTGHEDKYVFLREHSEYKWNYEILHECVRTDDSCFEEFYHLKLLREGWPMQNMRLGDAFHDDYIRSAMDQTITSIAALRVHKQRCKVKFLQNKAKSNDDSNTTVFVEDLSLFMKNGGRESAGIQAIKARRSK